MSLGDPSYDASYDSSFWRLTAKASPKAGCIFAVVFLALFAAAYFYVLADHDGGNVSLTLLLPPAAQVRLDGQPVTGLTPRTGGALAVQAIHLKVAPGKHAVAVVENGKAHGFAIELAAESSSNIYHYKDGQLARQGMP